MLYLLFFCCGNAICQSRSEQLLHCKVVSDSASVEGINVINLVTEQTTVTDNNGEFRILAQLDDLLVLTAVNFEYKRKIIEEDDVKKSVIIIKMVPKITQLDEVIINEYPNITAESLGIIPKGQKTYTQAERKLHAAQSGPVDILANLISGRTKNLKKELAVSRKELLLQKMEFLYDDKYYIETLQIAPDYIRAFQYFLVEEPEFVAALKAKNKTMTMFLASKFAVNFNALQSQN